VKASEISAASIVEPSSQKAWRSQGPSATLVLLQIKSTMTANYQQLNAEERGALMAMNLQGCSARAIARTLKRAPSTITRELKRNGHWPEGKVVQGRPRHVPGYDAQTAGKRATKMRRRTRRVRKLLPNTALWARVRQLLEWDWSPEQVAAMLKREQPQRLHMQASHETIYTAIYARPKGELRKEMISLLRQARGVRKRHGRSCETRGILTDMLSIHMRPPEVEDRLVPGHWEGDLIKGARNQSSVGTLVCRKTCFVMIVKLDGATALDVFKGFEAAFSPLDKALLSTLTYDQGKEMALHKQLAESTGLTIYFADPHSPWQRGRNENINGLIRQYLPKGTDLSVHSQRELDRIAWRLNTRPRATLDWSTPAEAFFQSCLDQKIPFPDSVAVGV
jgi:IS30 family transposase